MAVILETERLRLRTWTLNDAEEGFRIWSDAEVMRYVGTGHPHRSVEETRGWLGRMIAHQEQHGFCYWAVEEKKSGQLIGSCGVTYLKDEQQIDFGYTLAQSFWGRGYATEAAGACLRYAFKNLNLPEIVAGVDSRNVASQRVLEKIGFIYQRTEHLDGADDLWYAAANVTARAKE